MTEVLEEKALGSERKIKVLRDFDWTAKLVFNSDTTVEFAKPLVQVCLHFVDDSATAVYEFTAEELEHFLNELKKAC